MRTVITGLAICAALCGCKKKEQPAPAVGSAANASVGTAGSAAAPAPPTSGTTGSATNEAPPAAGSAAFSPDALAAGTTPDVVIAKVPRPPEVTEAHVAIADKLVASLDKMGAAVTAAGSDCKKVVMAIETGAKDLDPIRAEVQSIKKLGDSDDKVNIWYQSTYAPKFGAGLQPMIKASTKCGNDPAFVAAMKKVRVEN